MTRDDIHTCSYLCERPACIKAQRDELVQKLLELVAQAAAAEREACAKVCFDMAQRHDDIRSAALEMASEYIRARGEA